jgi:hypothetical protein
LSDTKPKLEQFAVNGWRTPKLVLRADLPDQCPQFYFDSRAPSPASSISNAKSDESRPDANVPAFRPDDRNDLQDQRKPSIHLDQEPAIVVREMSAALRLASQDHQLMSERGVLSLKLIFDLKAEAKTATTKHRSPIIPPA